MTTVGVTTFRRRGTGVSHRGRTAGHENVPIQRGDIVAAPSQGTYAYVLREGETQPPADIKRIWAEYKKVDMILAETIKVGLTPREIVRNYTANLNIDCHGMGKGARERKFENYFGPRIGSNGPEWMWDIPLPPNHHFVLEYFIYLPWPSSEHEDQYLFWWDHEQAIATENGVEYLSPPQDELYLIK